MANIPQSNVNAGSYNTFPQFADFSYNCISYLMENNEVIWKLLKYNTNDAWKSTYADLTQAEKAALIYDGSEDTSKFRVFLDGGQPDAVTGEIALLKIYPVGAKGNNHVWGSVTMCLDSFAHSKVNTMSNYRTRTAWMTQQLIETFNGVSIGGLGKLMLDSTWDTTSKLNEFGVTPFKGYQLILSTAVG
jgi:hypothetical protein